MYWWGCTYTEVWVARPCNSPVGTLSTVFQWYCATSPSSYFTVHREMKACKEAAEYKMATDLWLAVKPETPPAQPPCWLSYTPCLCVRIYVYTPLLLKQKLRADGQKETNNGNNSIAIKQKRHPRGHCGPRKYLESVGQGDSLLDLTWVSFC